MHACQRDPHPLLVDDAPAVGKACLLGPAQDGLEVPVDHAGGRERNPLVIELVRDHLPALVLLADERRRRHADVLVVRDVREAAAEQVDGRMLESRLVRVDEQDRDAFVLRRVGIGPAREPHPVGVVPARREHLLPVDDVLIAVAHRPGTQRGQVRAGGGLRVADREVQFAGEDAREEVRLLLVTPETHERGADRVERHQGHRDAGALGLVVEDELLGGGAALPAVLLRPADAEPPVGAHLADEVAVGVAAGLGTGEGGAARWRHQLLEVVAQLVLQLALLAGQVDAQESGRYRRASADCNEFQFGGGSGGRDGPAGDHRGRDQRGDEQEAQPEHPEGAGGGVRAYSIGTHQC